jgi:ATP-dependent RNA helicase DeaD
MTVFAGVTPVFAGALTKRGYAALTPVQAAVLAPEADGADLLVSAQTGSGKTVAFGLAMAPTLLGEAGRFPEIAGRAEASDPLAVIVAPTRELALQVCRELEWLYEPTGAKTVSCVGGMDMRKERRVLLDGAHIVVGTPGRLCDHIRRGSLDMSSVRVMVLDEADEMLDLGFREDLEFILGAAPAERRTLMFSATVPKPIAMLAKRFQRDAVRISTARENEQHADIDYRAMPVAGIERENAVINVLRFFEAGSAMVFCATREGVKHLASRLGNRGFAVVALSGELSQNERTHALQAMRDGRARVCVCTDVASRGIDLPNLDLVIHADLPNNSDTLQHRSGRTGRAGRNGICVIIIPHSRRRGMERMLRMASINAQWMQPPTAAAILERDRERLLHDPVLSAELSAEDSVFARELLALHSPEQIAAAYLRVQQAGRPTPEEVVDAGSVADAPRHVRSDFEAGVWFKISVGRKQRAEPRWLLPLICRAGGVEKRHVGSIRILEDESQFEITPDSVDKFIKSVGPGPVEKSIMITRIDGQPGDAAGGGARSYERPARAKTYGKHGAEGRRFPARQGDAEGAAGASGRPFHVKTSDAEAAAGTRERPHYAKTGDADGAAGGKGRPFHAKDGDAPGAASANGRPFHTKPSEAEGAGARERPHYAKSGDAEATGAKRPFHAKAADAGAAGAKRPFHAKAADAGAAGAKRPFHAKAADAGGTGAKRPFHAKSRDAEGAAGFKGRRFFPKKGEAEGVAGGKRRPFFSKSGDADGGSPLRRKPSGAGHVKPAHGSGPAGKQKNSKG